MALYIYTVTLLAVLLVVVYKWMHHKYEHWNKQGVKGPKPKAVFGNFWDVMSFKESPGNLMHRLYKSYPNEQMVGIYRGFTPGILLRDPEVIKQVMIKDFSVFQDRGVKTVNDEFREHLFAVEGAKWRILRQKITPIFTSGKIKNMMPLIEKCVIDYMKYIDDLIDKKVESEMRDLASKFTLAVISSCAFGIDVDTFNDKPNAFLSATDEFFSPPYVNRITRFADNIFPGIEELLRRLNIVDALYNTRKFFLSFVDNMIHEREGKPKLRNDLMDLIIELKEQGVLVGRENDKVENVQLTAKLMAAQVFIFYAAGLETSSATMSFFFHEMALNQDIQDRVYTDICKAVNKHGSLTYESLNDMVYLEMCVDEVLRKYPVVDVLNRQAMADYQFPVTNTKMKKGTLIYIPTMALQSDPQYFPNPEIFDPERFAPENKGAIPQCVYMPFGEGPRHCIGLRFAKVQIMIGLAAFLRKFRLEPSNKTETKLKLDKMAQITIATDKGIWVKISRRK